MGLIRSLVAKITTRVDVGGLFRFNSGVAKTKKELNFAARSAKNARRQFNQMAFAAKAGFAVFAGSRILKALTVDYAEAADKVAKFSKATGLNIITYQGFIHAAELSGVSQEEVNKALLQLPKRANDASNGIKKMADAYKELGVEVVDADGELRSADDLLLDVADGLKNMENRTKASALAQDLLGKSGAKLLVMFDEGSDGIRKMIGERQKLGDVFGLKAAAEAEKFNDELLRAKRVAKGVRNQIARKLLPTITRILEKFRLWAMESGNVDRALGRLKIAGAALIPIFTLLASAKVVAAFVAMKGAIISVVIAIKAMGSAAILAQAKMLLIPLALAGIVLLLEDIYTFAKGGESAVGSLFGDSKEATLFLDILKEIASVFGEIGDELGPAFVDIGRMLKKPFKELWDLIKPIVPDFAVALRWALIGVAAIIWLILKVVVLVIRAVKALVGWIWNDATSAVRDGLGAAWKWLGEIVAEIWTGIKEIAEGVAWAVGKAWDGVVWALKKVLEGIVWVWEKIKGAGSSAGAAVGAVWAAAGAAISAWLDGFVWAWGKVKAAASWASDKAAAAWAAATGLIKKGLSTLASWKKIKGAASAAASWTKDKFLAAAKAIRGAFEKVNSKIRSALKSAGGKVKKAAGAVADLVSSVSIGGNYGQNLGLTPERARAPGSASASATATGGGPTNIKIVAPITVSGSLNMDAPETADKLKAAARAALAGVVKENFTDRKPAVTAKPAAANT